MADIRIIGYPFSNYVWTARIVAHEKGVEVELDPFTAFEARGEEHRALHPWVKMPVLQHNGLTLAETAAITRYIDVAFDGPRLQPEDPRERAIQDQWISAVNAYLDPDIIRKWLLPQVFGDPDDERTKKKIAAGKKATPGHLAALNEAYDGHDFVAGDDFSLADAFIAPILYYLSTDPEGAAMIAAQPNVARGLETMKARESFKATTPPPPNGR